MVSQKQVASAGQSLRASATSRDCDAQAAECRGTPLHPHARGTGSTPASQHPSATTAATATAPAAAHQCQAGLAHMPVSTPKLLQVRVRPSWARAADHLHASASKGLPALHCQPLYGRCSRGKSFSKAQRLVAAGGQWAVGSSDDGNVAALVVSGPKLPSPEPSAEPPSSHPGLVFSLASDPSFLSTDGRA